MVSDSELIERLREVVRTSDLNTTTTTTVRRKLEEDFGVDLLEKKAFIREQIDLYLQTLTVDEEQVQEEAVVAVDEEVDDDEKSKLKSEDEEGSSDEEEPETSNGKKNKKRKASNKPDKEVKKRGGFNKLCCLSPQLQDLVGVPELARTEVVKQLWAYIREKDLQDPKNRRNILCDEALRNIFRVDCINMFQMNKALSKHIWPLESDEAPVKPVKKEKQQKQDKSEDADDPKPKGKRQKAGGSGSTSGFLAPLQLSDALVKFIGTGETALSRSEVVKKMWSYIKENNLQDPSDKRRIICDDKLKELFDVDSFTGFTVSKLLTTHFVKS